MAARFALAALAMVLVVLTACSADQRVGQESPSGQQSPGGTVLQSAAPGTSLPAPPSANVDPTSEVLIGAALEANAIDYATSLLYRVYAAFGRPELPADYRSDVVDLHAATHVFREIDAHEAELTDEIRDALEPFRVRPSDPSSIFNVPAPVAAILPIAQAPKWVNKPAAGGKAQVWVMQSDASNDVLDYYVSEVNRVWPKVFSLTNEPLPDQPADPLASVNPDSAIDLYFADVGTVDPRIWACHLNPGGKDCSILEAEGGYTQEANPKSGRTSSAYSVIDSGVRGLVVASHIAHELMHTSQFSYDRFEGSWLLDSTATWGAFRTLQLLNHTPEPEYEYLGDFFAELDEPLRRDEGLNRYASWLYFFSLQIDHGDQVARKVFEKMAAEGEQNAAAVDQAFPFARNFGTFAASNWDTDLTPRYRKANPSFPAGLQAGLSHYPELGSGDEDQPPFETSFLSADYAGYQFTDDVRQVVVENLFTTLVAECNCIPSVWLIANVRGTWQEPEQMTGDRRKFCFSNPAEDLEELVLIVANPDWEGLLPLDADMMPLVRAHEAPCTGGHGTVTISREKHGTYTSNRNNPVKVDMTDTATISFELEADEFSEGIYNATHSSITWSYSLNAVESADGCEIVEVGRGQGTWEGDSGPTVMLGWSSPDGTLFGMTPDEDQYVLQAIPPRADMPDADPRGYYEVSSRLCTMTVIPPGTWWPYSSMAFVSGALPEDGRTFSGSRQRTLPDLISPDVPTTETVSWSFSLDETAAP